MSWPLVKISDFCETGSGGTPSRNNPGFYGGSIPWVKSGELRESLINTTSELITEQAVEKSSAKIVPAGAILLAMYGATVGRMAILGINAATNQAVCNIIPDEKMAFNKYVYFALLNKVQFFLDNAVGGAQPNISQGIIKDVKIPLPPIPEQKRIAAILDKADSLRRKNQQAIQLAEKFLRAVFLDLFGDPVSNPKGFPVGTIRDLITSANYGTSAKASETDGEFPILRMGNITYVGGWDFSQLKYIDLQENEKGKYLTQKGDLLFNRTNSKELVGKTAVYESDEPMAIAGYLIRVRTNEYGNPYYIAAYLNSKHGKTTLFNMCKSIVGMANINAQELQDIKIYLPPKALQDKFEQIVISTNHKLKSFSQAEHCSDQMFSALSQKAFAGKL